MKRDWLLAAVALGLATGAAPAHAQDTPDGEAFVKAVREEDGDKAIQLLRENPIAVINARDDKGDTPLLIAIARRDARWTAWLLKEKADPNLANRAGDTPLIAAARIGYTDAVQWLMDLGAKIEKANRMGETPLIVAVQQRQPMVVRQLLERGANPDKADSAAGYSARDYAKRDTRMPELLRLIESAKTPAATAKLKF
ncbi:ankyrin repeat domain-containing protein [Sphingomonas sp.]|uniref:ankyrin repeat domain-containing protein n=1 Tax=Sphingomonas sp. TaxID=28214 RepID=UPI00286D7B0B|nr:ankyrin repeat domain-containing protein [Sphingomonas sp.]